MNIDFKNIVTKEEMQALTSEEVKKATQGGKFYSEQLKAGLNSQMSIRETRGKDVAFILDAYSRSSIAAKYLLASSIVMPNNDKLIAYLIKNGYDYFQIFSCAKLISKLKEYYSKTSEPIDIDISALEKLCFLIKKYYGISNDDLIIAKINELVVFKGEEFKRIKKELRETAKKTL